MPDSLFPAIKLTPTDAQMSMSSDGGGGPAAPAAAAGSHLITLSDALELSGEDDVQQIRELVLRGLDAKDFHPDCAHVLTQVEVLSLSHNAFQHLRKFEPMQNLVELNLNFNHNVPPQPGEHPVWPDGHARHQHLHQPGGRKAPGGR